jgi:hypothetical protein
MALAALTSSNKRGELGKGKNGEPGRGRTDNLRIRSPLLYPIGLRAREGDFSTELGKLWRLAKLHKMVANYEVCGLQLRRQTLFPTELRALSP